MEPFDFEEVFKPVLGMIAQTGTWPKRNPSILYRILGWLSVISLLLCTGTCLANSIVHFENTGNVIFSLCVSLAMIHAVVKHTVININKEKFYQILEFLKSPLFTSHGNLNVYTSKMMGACSFGRRMFIISGWTTGALIVVSPLFDLSSRTLPAPFPIDMKDKPIYAFLSAWFLQASGSLVTVWIIPGYDGMIIYLMGVAAAQLKILRETIQHSTDSVDGNVSSEDFDKIVNGRLRYCVIYHITIERYIEAMEDALMYSFLIQVLISLIITVFVGFNIIITPASDPNFIRCVFFFLAVIVELINVCVPGNEIILQSEKIQDACYMSDWIERGPSVRRTLFIIMERSKRPLKLTAAKFAVLSLPTLLSVLKSSISYFTVLNEVYSDPTKI